MLSSVPAVGDDDDDDDNNDDGVMWWWNDDDDDDDDAVVGVVSERNKKWTGKNPEGNPPREEYLSAETLKQNRAEQNRTWQQKENIVED